MYSKLEGELWIVGVLYFCFITRKLVLNPGHSTNLNECSVNANSISNGAVKYRQVFS